MAKPKKSVDPVDVGELPPERSAEDPLPGRTAEVHARYSEYLRLLDDVPVLVDVVSEPPRVVIRDFRLGQRPNVRRAAREDAYAVREQHAAEREHTYAEYERRGGDDAMQAAAAPARPLAGKKKGKPSKGGKRSKRRKR
jgi:hypothetical protein